MFKLKLAVAAALALVALSVVASSASADTAEIDPAGNISNISNGKITFGSSPTIQCNVTLNGTLASSADVTQDEHIGSITEVRVSNCAGGSVASINDLPWQLSIFVIQPEPFDLDDLSGLVVAMAGTDFTLSVFGPYPNCRYEGSAIGAIALDHTGTNAYDVDDTIADENWFLLEIGGSDLCPDEGAFRGSFDTSPDQELVTI